MKLTVFIVIALVILGAGFLFLNKPQNQSIPTQNTTPTLQPEIIDEKVDLTASFTIITGTITRNFSNPKYHNQSEDVYIELPDPSLIHIKKKGITWDNFFKTLPMKLNKDCLITGDGETLCNNQNGKLQFYLNDKEDKDLLDKEIRQNDKALIKFTPE